MEPSNLVPKNRIETGIAISPEVSAEVGGNINEIKNNQISSAEQKVETAILSADASVARNIASSTPTLPVSLPSVSTTQSDAQKTTAVDDPLVANDGDMIESEWIKRAKKVVHETANDPAERDDEVSELRVDYQGKRFGIKTNSDLNGQK